MGSDTPVMPYSVSKPFAAVCALVLVDRGLLDLDRPVKNYWPEMTADPTVRQLLSHQSGHASLEQPVPTEAFYDLELLCRLIAGQTAQWPPGSGCGESALLYGHLVGEVMRRIDGRRVGAFLRDEICGPFGLDFQIGLTDPELRRVADLSGLEGLAERIADRSPTMARALVNPPGSLDARVVNSSAWRRAEIPAVNGHGTARGVAGLFAALGAGRLLSPATTGGPRRGRDPRCRSCSRLRGSVGARRADRRRRVRNGRNGRQPRLVEQRRQLRDRLRHRPRRRP